MALIDIINKIVADSKKQVEQIQKSADEQVKQLQKEYADTIKKKEEEIDNNVEKKKTDIDRKMETLAKMESRSEVLATKQKIIEKIFKEAVAKLNKLEEGPYQSMLVKLLKNLPQMSEGKIIPAHNRKSETEKALKDAGLSYDVESEGKFAGGVIFVSDTIEINSTFENIILKDLKSKAEPEVARILFQAN